MHSFQWVQGSLGIIVALGMTRLAVSVTHMFVARRQVRLDWLPFTWAICVFFLLLQFSWNFVALEPAVKAWTFSAFLPLLIFVLNLFVAAALILPNSESQAGGDLRTWHREHGRWAMPFIAAYALMAYPVNWYFMHAPPLENPASAILTVLAAMAFFSRSRLVQGAAAVPTVVITAGLVLEMALAD